MTSYSVVYWRHFLSFKQKGGSGEEGFSDVAKFTYAQLIDKDNPPEGIDLQRKEVSIWIDITRLLLTLNIHIFLVFTLNVKLKDRIDFQRKEVCN